MKMTNITKTTDSRSEEDMACILAVSNGLLMQSEKQEHEGSARRSSACIENLMLGTMTVPQPADDIFVISQQFFWQPFCPAEFSKPDQNVMHRSAFCRDAASTMTARSDQISRT